MKRFLFLMVAIVVSVKAQEPVPPPATSADIDAGTATFKFISPAALAGSSFSAINAILNLNGVGTNTIIYGNSSRTNSMAVGTNWGPFNVSGIISGNGSGLTALNGSSIASGTVALARLPSAVVTNSDTRLITFDKVITKTNQVDTNLRWVDTAADPVMTLAELGGLALHSGSFSGNASNLTNASPAIATNNPSASDGFVLSKSGNNLKLVALSGGGDLLAANNLGDVDDAGAARTNLTAHSATSLTAGTVGLARLPSAVVTNSDTRLITFDRVITKTNQVDTNLRWVDTAADPVMTLAEVGGGLTLHSGITRLNSSGVGKDFEFKNASWWTDAVGYLRPVTAGKAMAFDLMVNGSGPEAHLDICSDDVEADPDNWEALELIKYKNGRAHVGTKKLGTGTVRELRLNENGGNVSVGYAGGGGQNNMLPLRVYNQDAGTGAFTSIGAHNGPDDEDSARLLSMGTGWTTSGGFRQDSGAIDVGGNLAGGLSLLARAATGEIRFYTGGAGDSNERMRIANSGITLTGKLTLDKNLSFTAAAMGGTVIDVTRQRNTLAVEENTTLTFSGTPAARDTFGLEIINTESTNVTITIPSSSSMSLGADRTEFVMGPGSRALVGWEYTGSAYLMTGDPWTDADLDESTNPAGTNYVTMFDRTAHAYKKVQINNLPTGGGGGDLGANLSSSTFEIQSDVGLFTIVGTTGSNNEDITVDLESDSNVAAWSSSSGVNVWQFGSIIPHALYGVFDSGTASAGWVRLVEDADNGSSYVDIIAPADLTDNRTITLPDASGTVALVSGALGTPSSINLANGTALPVSGITASTSTAIGVGSVELGHATDTTIARSAAGVITVEGAVVTTANSQSSVHATPNTTTPLSPTWTGDIHTVWQGANGTINLPAASGYSGRGLLIYNTGAFTITIDPNASEVVVRGDTVQTGGVSFTLSSGAGNYVALISDGARWITLGYIGTLSVGS